MKPLHTTYFKFIFLCSFFLMLCACKEKPSLPSEALILDIRIKKDPQRLHPMIHPHPAAREIYQYIHLPLADFHPVTLELTPILIKEIPLPKKLDNGDLQYEFEIVSDAIWSDGQAVTGYDYDFTIKAALHPEVQSSGWRTYLEKVKSVVVDPQNPRLFSVVISDYMLATETTTTIQIFPKHIYDSKSALDNVSISQLKSEEEIKVLLEKNDTLRSFAQEMNSAKYSRDIVIGCGPYTLDAWETNQYVELDKTQNYWGNSYKNNPFLQAGSQKIRFLFVPDETTTISMLKSGALNVATFSNGTNFNSLKTDEDFSKEFSFLTPEVMKYYYLCINNRRPYLAEKSVRIALSHLVDVNKIINTLDYGLGKPLVGHFHPSKPYYNNDLKPRVLDIDQAITILENAGWIDTDKNGIRDKIIDGSKYELDIDLLVTPAKLGQSVGLMLKQNAEKAGVNINLIKKEFKIIRSEHLKPLDFDMIALVVSLDSAPDDPYSRWHSDNINKGKRNESGFANTVADDLILKIRKETDESKRKQLYLKLQEVMYEEQPVIFLYSPTEKIVISKDINGSSTSKRPGYLANTFTSKVSTFSDN